MENTAYYINEPSGELPQDLTHQIFSSSDARKFHSSLAQYKPSPLVELKEAAKELGVKSIFVKDESRRFGLKAFKGLGASYAIHRILEENPEIDIFCTATDGNHGRAVAWSARMLDKKAYVFMPAGSTTARVEAIRNEGAEVEVVDGNYEAACARAKEMSDRNGWQLVQDTATEDYEEIPAYIMAGYFTHFKEMEDSIHSLPEPGIDIVFLQAGVGSWPAAAAWYYQNRYGKNRPQLVIVEPAEAAGFLTSFKSGKRSSPSGNSKTMMAGLNCGIPSTTAWEILRNTATASMAIEDSFMEQAIRMLHNGQGDDPRVEAGESGAGGFAGFLALINDNRFAELKEALGISAKTRVLVYNTEGATDPQNFQKIINQTPG
ncbi:diaminopropionate ammonia-lyase [Antarcticibacterium flavum]|uniref:Diaminopropionate ammonia-lyase n=1 Tax=Antarcticibacterium flavum TaxID=2058175 RepID=A0A5B7X482_9FLAO|nr:MULTISPECIES: diaminopropionate ammonia-lyase [Antarcticibacterium]MCM4159154.1 diaminopropionate ammonia-lyase [Antarcticibacterium sp. W02-3]QCY69552.1 diaminopropionate ammonia-lyase [Antarcticibacterium flavum]